MQYHRSLLMNLETYETFITVLFKSNEIKNANDSNRVKEDYLHIILTKVSSHKFKVSTENPWGITGNEGGNWDLEIFIIIPYCR